jgi:hypothetical protein
LKRAPSTTECLDDDTIGNYVGGALDPAAASASDRYWRAGIASIAGSARTIAIVLMLAALVALGVTVVILLRHP